jgi:hypothetical protein
MSRPAFRFLFALAALGSWAAAGSAQQPAAQPPPAQPRTAQPPAQEQPTELIGATKEETWTLGDQQWDFRDIATAYVPVKGSLNPKTGVVEWTLEIVKELSAGEVGTQENLEGSPFKPTFIDEERVAVQEDARIRVSKITGKVGDRIKLTLQLPKEELLAKVRLVRIERRTKVGF